MLLQIASETLEEISSDDWHPDAGNHVVLDLLNQARSRIQCDPACAVSWIDRIAAVVALPDDRPFEHLLLPATMEGHGGAITVRGGLAPWQSRRLVQLIEERIADQLSIELFARVCRLSTGHLCRAFKASFGETPHSFVVRRRIRRAQRLMLVSQDNLSQIAVAVGLTDQAHLNRLFRKLVGTTPLTWRRAHLED